MNEDTGGMIAIVGMAGRFPGAADVDRFWENLCAGRESIVDLTEAELRAAGVDPADLDDPRYVRRGAVLADIDRFDAGFFGFSPKEAQITDPQQRLFLETAWNALESAACDPATFDGSIGVFAGSALSTYLLNNLAPHPDLGRWANTMQVALGNDKDSLATRVAHALNLNGPAYSVQSYCSTSLVAVCAAATSLVSGECDVALAGGVALSVPHRVGYHYQEGGIASPDGRCRAFDAAAAGAPLGNGVGVVVLRRLDDALADGDRVYAVIRGWAVNNDGAGKAGFTAPGVRGQREVVVEALANAGVPPATIDYIEAHGTGTALGDAAEVAALAGAFADVEAPGSCALGSVKTNIGHLDRAAGVAGLIKTALALHHATIPPTLHFSTANPELRLERTPFTVPTALTAWPERAHPRRAGVSAFGIGGTNAHVVLEQAPPLPPRTTRARPAVLVLSARSAAAADARVADLAAATRTGVGGDLADLAHTLHSGRTAFEHRRAVVVGDLPDAAAALAEPGTPRVLSAADVAPGRPVGLLVAGVGEQYPGLAAEVYRTEPRMRELVAECAAVLDDLLGIDLAAELFPADGLAGDVLLRPETAQPAAFAVGYAMSRLLMEWGVVPDAIAGYSVGEYVAATLAGVLDLPSALRLLVHRAELIAALPAGAMVAVGASAARLERIAGPLLADLDTAAVNAPEVRVLAGTAEAVDALCRRLDAAEISYRRLTTTHAYHSRMLAPAADALTAWVARHVEARAPRIPYLSNVTGTWIRPEEVTDPGYWARHMCATVRFADAVGDLLTGSDRALVEVGPGRSLGALVRQHPAYRPAMAARVVATLPGRHEPGGAQVLHTAIAGLWLAGVDVDWAAYHAPDRPRRVTLPTYPFQGERYWIDAPARAAAAPARDPERWLHEPSWREVEDGPTGEPPGEVLILGHRSGLAPALAQRLATPSTVLVAGADATAVRPDRPEDYARAVAALVAAGRAPTAVVHLWGTGTAPGTDPARRDLGLMSLLYLARALAAQGVRQCRILLVTDGALDVVPGDVPTPEKAIGHGAAAVLGQEYPGLECRVVDLPAGTDPAAGAAHLAAELGRPGTETVAYRDGVRRVRWFRPVANLPHRADPLRDGGTYLITGGLGAIGLAIAGHIAATVTAPRLVLTGRSGLPPRAQWPQLRAGDGVLATRIRAVTALEEAGARVLVLAADATTPGAMARVVAQARALFGSVDGVVHCAGVTEPEAFGPIETMSEADVAAHLAAKVEAILAVEEALGDAPIDFCVVQSSISSVLGGLGFGAYAAANALLDAHVRARAARGRPWLTVNWDTWRTGEPATGPLGATMSAHSMSVAEGLVVFDRVLRCALPQVVVSVGDLDERIRQWGTASPAEAGPPAHERPALPVAYVPATSDIERRLTALWQDVLGVGSVGVNDNFFDLGGTSLIGLQLLRRVTDEFDVAVPTLVLFEAPTVAALARHLAGASTGQESAPAAAPRRPAPEGGADDLIAVVGMAGRFPGAADVERFWANLRDGVESIARFTPDELIAAGVPAEQVHDPAYVPARPVLDGIDLFDAGFFGYSPREAELTDPQHRIFLECAWHALENSGYAGDAAAPVGVFAGTNISTYLAGLYRAGHLTDQVNDYQAVIGNDKDALATTVSYKLNLTGPSMAVQTFCSTSLVAVHLAAQSLRAGECELALAGGVSVRVPDRVGHRYTPGGMESPDGHVRTFDARARGSMFGDGVGVVVLKRLTDALADGDTVHAVIRGSAVNNDGALKVGFTAPSVGGQAQVIAAALAAARVEPDTVSYVEAHGTATELGDPIEMLALSRAYGTRPPERSCPIGSVKTNVGHLDRAAGVSGLIKTVLALRHRQLPPSLHYTEPNPEIDFANGPFHVNTRLAQWQPAPGAPLRAGINSLGMGGTNVHVIVEEPPATEPGRPGRTPQSLVLSARTVEALEEAGANLAAHLRGVDDEALADVAYTLQVGRRRFAHRRTVACSTVDEAVRALSGDDPARVLTRHDPVDNRPLAMVFAGVGEQYPGMAVDLYGSEPVYRAVVDECLAVLEPLLGPRIRTALTEPAAAVPAMDLRAMLGRAGTTHAADRPADDVTATALAQPTVFVVEYAVARLLMSWGAVPESLAGYSLGEYVAATLAGVLSLPDALKLVAYRATLIDALPAGAMLAVPMAPERLAPLIGEALDVAAVNAPGMSVVAGPAEAVADLERRLAAREVACRRLATTHAFHSRALVPVAERLTAWIAAQITLHPPRVPYVSNVTGDWIRPEEAVDPGYWARHMCGTVRFADVLGRLLAEPERVLVEVGPGQSLGAFARQHPACTPQRGGLLVPTLPGRHEPASAVAGLTAALGRLWLLGVPVDWAAHHDGAGRRRVPLPGYPFQRERYWVAGRALPSGPGDDAPPVLSGNPREMLTSLPRESPERWFFVPSWRRAAVPAGPPADLTGTWLVFADGGDLTDAVVAALAERGATTVTVEAGVAFAEHAHGFTIRSGDRDDHARLLASVPAPRGVVHLWSVGRTPPELDPEAAEQWLLDRAYFSPLWTAQALGASGVTAADVLVVTAGAVDVTGTDEVRPAAATSAGPCRVIPLELPRLAVRQLDVVPPNGTGAARAVAGRLLGELSADPADVTVAWRGRHRWLPEIRRIAAPAPAGTPALRPDGVYVLTGGLGGIGAAVARGIAATAPGARIALLGRTALPEPEHWPQVLGDPVADPELRRRVQVVSDLAGDGAQVRVYAADVADADAVGTALDAVRQQFGRIDGVFHLAGAPGMGLLQFKTTDNAAIAFGPKVTGTRVLLERLAADRPDFVVLFSSISSITGGGPGQVDYCAANAYLDAVAQRAGADGLPVRSVNWGEWRWNAWGAGLSGYAPAVRQFFDDNRRHFGITFEEGWQALHTLLQAGSHGEPQVIVSTQDFRVLADLSRTFTIDTVLSLSQELASRHARPELGTSYVAPGTDTERVVEKLWAEALGIERVGIHDNFFELGGNSLLGVDLIARLRHELRHDALTPHALYLAPTVHALAQLVSDAQAEPVDDRRARGELRRRNLRTRRTS
ncbi:hypothetical protein Val02_56930 [Virgisporangium aliadipatigenens]|uniref:Acyl transferase domain-containing protein n=1 Tax=Virgisporangium aliadipatigenens TaxID=741659 RepID=A0A8J4DU45_9ACTN|nr:type I polyketide synthase [Virgisporangium aliadipatigenens]GIJ48807.1 hypothetical protein Val02_56930 [Virgisporangium aliadipatigenens]